MAISVTVVVAASMTGSSFSAGDSVCAKAAVVFIFSARDPSGSAPAAAPPAAATPAASAPAAFVEPAVISDSFAETTASAIAIRVET